MNCKEFNKNLPGMFDLRDGPLRDEMLEHIDICARCSQLYESWRETVERLTPSARITAPDDIKQRIMHHSNELDGYPGITNSKTGKTFKRWQKVLFGAAAVLLAGFSFSLFYPGAPFRGGKEADNPKQFLSLVTQAMAAQRELVYSDGVTHLTVKRILPAVSDPDVAKCRWFPMCSVQPDGSLLSNRVLMRARPNQPYEVKEDLWVDYESGLFSHIISFEGEVLFANSFDGININTMSIESDDSFISTPAVPEFSLPEKLPQKFGMLADWDSLLSTNYVEQHNRMSLTGETALESGEKVRVLEIKGLPDHEGVVSSAHLLKIRISDNTLAETEFITDGETSELTRYLPPKKIQPLESPWKIEGLQTVPEPIRKLYGLYLEMDVIRTDITREEMLELSEFPICDFDSNPAWTDSSSIYFLRMFGSLKEDFTLVYLAAPGGKHVILNQADYWSPLAERYKASGPLYTSSSGFKIYSLGDRAKWYANIYITASSGVHGEQPSADRVAYIVETPAGTWCKLAINGTLSDAELHALVDKLVMLTGQDTTIF